MLLYMKSIIFRKRSQKVEKPILPASSEETASDRILLEI